MSDDTEEDQTPEEIILPEPSAGVDPADYNLTNILDFPKMSDEDKQFLELEKQREQIALQAANIAAVADYQNKDVAAHSNPFSPRGNPFTVQRNGDYDD
jgi:hypothetical protein